MLDAATRDRLLRRIGLESAPDADAAGLRVVHRAFVSSIPFEALTVQLGESRPLDAPELVERVLHGGRGGYCFEVNTVLHSLLEALGFAVERREGIVGERGAFAAGEPTNHMTLVVDGAFIADAGLGENPLDPIPLTEGRVTLDAFAVDLEREGDGWWVGLPEFASSPGFRFGDAPAALADFAVHHERLSTSPASGFIRNLVVQQPFADRIVTLRSRTRFEDGPGLRERRVLADIGEFAAALRDPFGIDPDALGEVRLARLWAQAVAQHEAREA